MTQQIDGYRTLTTNETELINTVKQLGVRIGETVEPLRNNPELDQRWVNMGIATLQNGLMQVIRGIARPTTF